MGMFFSFLMATDENNFFFGELSDFRWEAVKLVGKTCPVNFHLSRKGKDFILELPLIIRTRIFF